MHNQFLAILLGLGSALTIAWGTVIRHRLATKIPDGATTLGGVWTVISNWAWWAGVTLAMIGYGLQIAALGFGTLLLVQPLLVMSLMFTLPLASLIAGRRVSKSETTWALLLSIAVTVVVLLGRPQPGDVRVEFSRWLPSLAVGVVVFAVIYWLASTMLSEHKALLLGINTGWLYGYVAVLSKAVVDIFWVEGATELAKSWELWLLITLALIGVAVQQASFNAGELRLSLPSMTAVEPIVAFALGYVILGERFQVHGWSWLWMGLAAAIMIGSTLALAGNGTPPPRKAKRSELVRARSS